MKKAFKMPTALTIVMIFLIIVGIMTWFVPTSVVVENDAGEKEIIFNAAFDEDGNVIEMQEPTRLALGSVHSSCKWLRQMLLK